MIGNKKPKLQVAPVIRRLVFPRAKSDFLRWLDELKTIKGMKRLIPAHFSAPIKFSQKDCIEFRNKINFSDWDPSKGNWSFLYSVDKNLLGSGVVPERPLDPFKD